MALRAWQLWGMSTVLAGGVVAFAQSPRDISGKATPAITQDHFHPEAAPPPRLLPQSVRDWLPQAVRDWQPSKPAPPTARDFTGNMISIQTPGVPTPDLDIPVRATSFGTPPGGAGHAPAENWKARAALDVAEMYFDACDTSEARAWYGEVIKLAPESKYAAAASERLNRIQVIPAGGQSSEPPLADANRPETQARIR